LGGRAIQNPVVEAIERKKDVARAANARLKRSRDSEIINAAITRLAKPIWKTDPAMKKSPATLPITIAVPLNKELDKPLSKSAIEKRFARLKAPDD